MIWTALTFPFSLASSLLLFLARLLRIRALFGGGDTSRGLERSDPRTSAERFVRQLEEQTGGTTSRSIAASSSNGDVGNSETRAPALKRLPPFFVGGYADALRSAKEQIKILAIVLVSREHGDVDRFKTNTLTDGDLVDLLSRDDFIVWGGDVREREAYQVATTLQASTYPFVAFIALQPPRPASRTSAGSSSSSPRAAILSRLEGSPSSATSAASIASHISDVLLPGRAPTLIDYELRSVAVRWSASFELSRTELTKKQADGMPNVSHKSERKSDKGFGGATSARGARTKSTSSTKATSMAEVGSAQSCASRAAHIARSSPTQLPSSQWKDACATLFAT